MTATSTNQPPGTFAIPSVSPLYVDGIPIQYAGEAASKVSSGQDFWSSQPRNAGDKTAEQLTVTLGQPRLINYVAVDLPHFPHTATFWWLDDEGGWNPVQAVSGAPLTIVTTGSVPAVVDNPAALAAKLNPYHYGAGHWVHHDEQVIPFTTSSILIRAVRPAPAARLQLPLNPQKKACPYPLGVQNLDFGSRVTSASDVPAAPRSPVTLSMRQPWTTTVDVNGSPVQVSLRENRASDMLAGGYWRSGPQPSASSVTCLYLDSRDETGSAQRIDRFYLEPITSGVRFNLYYSPVPPPAGTVFQALDDPLIASLLNASGTVLPATSKQGIVFGTDPGWLTLSNQAAGTVSENPWWTGIEIMPAFGSDDPGTYVVADAGILQLTYSGGTWTANVPPQTDPYTGELPAGQPSGGVLGEWEFDFSPGDRIQFVAGYTGEYIFAWSPLGQMFHSPASQPLPPAPVFRFGGLQDIDDAEQVLAGNHTLTSFILKQEQADLSDGIPDEFLYFAADPSAFVAPPLDNLEAESTLSAVARFDPSFLAAPVCQWGFVGGLGAAYEACPWVPVQRSYTLSRGFVEFDPVMAAAWKFEFTALAAEPYEYIKPPQVTSSYFFPQNEPTEAQKNPTTPAVLDDGLDVSQSVAPTVTFNDTPAPSADATPGIALPTEALYAPDPQGAAQMASLGGSLYNFQPWQAPAVIPSSVTGGSSAYQQQTLTVSSRVAYFAALASVGMYKTDATAADDTAQYLDLFHDADNIDPDTLQPGGWSFTAGSGLTAPSNLSPEGASVQSVILNSAHAVTGVQFATVQSDPVQLLEDSDFSDPAFANWAPVGDAAPITESANTSQLGVMAQVARAGAPDLTAAQPPASWAWVEATYSSWGNLTSLVAEWGDFGNPPATTAMGGVTYAGTPVPTTGNGRLYAAARVFSATALSAPLYLQLLDGGTGAVIAEAEQPVSGGTVTEWFAGYTLGSVTISDLDWAGVEEQFPDWASIALDGPPAWNVIDTGSAPLGTTVTAQLIQKESTGDTWDVDNISVFEDSLVWEFSNDGGNTWQDAYDIRNNPRGVVTFPVAQPGTGTQLMWRASAYRPGLSVSSLAIRPWYVTAPHGIPPRAAGVGHGPNMAPLDHYAPVESDPRWQLSSGPVPSSWFFSVRQALGISTPASDFPGPPQPVPDVVLGEALVWEPLAVEESGPQTWTDLYSATFTDTYYLADGGDIYTDAYCDIYGADYLVITGTEQQAQAWFAGTGYLTAEAGITLSPDFGLGADAGAVPADDPSVTAWEAATGLPLKARRIPLGNQFPDSLADSPAAGDAGVRRVLFDIRPDATTDPYQLDAFLASCAEGGLDASVSVWAGADTAFSNIQDWLALLPEYAAVIHRNGYEVVLAVGNTAIAGNWLARYYPGDDIIDVIAPVYYCTGPAPGSGGDTLAVAQSFADAHGKAFGLSDFGVDSSKYSAVQGEAFLAYIARLFAARKKAASPCYDLIWVESGSFGIGSAPAGLQAAFRALGLALE